MRATYSIANLTRHDLELGMTPLMRRTA